MKKCIFYLPYKLDENGAGARMIRPRKMIQAFKDIGYDVFVIAGWSSERKTRIAQARRNILNGVKYDFIYSENSTMPTLLTDPGHLPTHPFLDFAFFRFARKHGIKIGLFYCDVYWKFDFYGKGLSKWKRELALANYKYDIRQYKKLLNAFYVPDFKMCDYLNEPELTKIARELPPGADNIAVTNGDRISATDRDYVKKPLTVFYVGGLGGHYQISELLKAVKMSENTQLILCCRDKEWEKEKPNLKPYMCDRVTVIHKNSDELEPYYAKADICSVLFQNTEYIDMAKPFKTYESIAHEIPVLSTRGTAIGDFVESSAIGWNIEFDANAIADVLSRIQANPEMLDEIRTNCRKAKAENLWTERAKTVADDLERIQ